METQPYPGKMLYENLFAMCNPSKTFEILSKGFSVLLTNADRLVKDAKILKEAGSYMSASFLGVTAREEMAKSHILIDACRLDLSRHESILRRLCKAFYNHVDKYAYYTILRLPRLHDMLEISNFWKVETNKWWPSDIESGEPDMPHETKYLREMPLYVDYIDWDKDWFNPQAKRGKIIISARNYEIENALDDLSLFHKTFNDGLYKPECLSIINNVYKGEFINEKTSKKIIDSCYEKAGKQIEKELSIPQNKFDSSFITKWPLYHFAANS